MIRRIIRSGQDVIYDIYDQLILIGSRASAGEMQLIVGNGWSREFVWDDRTINYNPEAAFFLINYHPICLTT